MVRIVGVDIPDNKRIDIALTYLYGIGRQNVVDILKGANINPSLRVKELSEENVNKIQKVLEDFKIEGDLRAAVTADIRRLREIGSYRGTRHGKNLPVRGQRTRHNARTKRGKRLTIGAIRKEFVEKMAKPAENTGVKTAAKTRKGKKK